MAHIYNITLTRNEVLTRAATWMNLENIMLNETSQSQKDKYCMILLISYIIWQIHRDRRYNKGNQGLGGGGNGELLFNGFAVSVWGHENVLEMDNGDGCTIL